jgi:hypothetical protein
VALDAFRSSSSERVVRQQDDRVFRDVVSQELRVEMVLMQVADVEESRTRDGVKVFSLLGNGSNEPK